MVKKLLIVKCTDCPYLGYIHFDGEGESCPLEFNFPVCSITDEDFDKKGKWNKDRFTSKSLRGYNSIPDWCPLENA
jgi:hypothetical protein